MKWNFTLCGASILFLVFPLALSRAAELPSGRADRAVKERSCESYGKGFAYSAATDSCIRVSGSVSTEYSYRPASPPWVK